ncbi:DUF883 family protein [Zestomonas carbonaria]|uniref:DUF883 domain-containing protein n=1 Tax=Zestomonas carbonaria TaxID=2762745 RepID=A0A7U7EMB6_9GAMM|nr:DUF883 family protein [Pseudomonas carbonaria]CAD5106730.1 putative protein YqjD [Pseudomonas carbonaria]
MTLFSRKQSLHGLEAEIQSLLASLEQLKEGASDESKRSLGAIRHNAERALAHSRQLLGEAYDEVKDKTYRAGIATRDYSREHPLATAGLVLGVVGLLGYLYYSSHRD